MDTVLPGKTINQIILVFPDTLWQIAGHPDLKRTITLAGKDVNTRLFRHNILENLLHKEYPSFPRKRE